MLEIVVCSLVVGSLGVQAVAIASWMCWQESVDTDREAEEEILTQYEAKQDDAVEQSQPDAVAKQLKDPRLLGWEFKIVRANRNMFREPAVLQRLCAEEAEAGWILLEKLDDRRVRFKRPMALREIVKPEFLSYDPYRSHYGSSWRPLTWLAALTALMAMILPAYLGYALVSQTLANSRPTKSLPATFPPLEQTPSP